VVCSLTNYYSAYIATDIAYAHFSIASRGLLHAVGEEKSINGLSISGFVDSITAITGHFFVSN